MSAAGDIERALGVGVRNTTPLTGGCVAEVHLAHLADGRRVVAKRGSAGGTLDVEGWMLGYLGEHSPLPVPAVLHAEPGLLVMTHVEHTGGPGPAGESRAAELLAACHGVTSGTYGLERDTLIGPLRLPNTPSDNWPRFFAEHRLLHFGRLAEDAGSLPPGTFGALERLAERAEAELGGDGLRPGLIHGDCWAGNALWRDGDLAAFIDPAIHYADPEFELAFIELMGNLGAAFWRRYGALRPMRTGDWRRRRLVYQLPPLLVHACLFGGGYGASVARIARELGV